MIHVDKFINSRIYIKKRGVKMTQNQTQTINSKAPIYTREELESKLRKLQSKLDSILEDFDKAYKKLLDIHLKLYKTPSISTDTADKIHSVIKKLESIVYDAVDEIIVNELELDTDIEKYEEEYNVVFSYTEERLLGVVMLSENETVRPVVVWTDYETVDYYEGEKGDS